MNVLLTNDDGIDAVDAVIHLTGGSATVRFGGRVHVNANQTPGIYSGTFMVNLEYT